MGFPPLWQEMVLYCPQKVQSFPPPTFNRWQDLSNSCNLQTPLCRRTCWKLFLRGFCRAISKSSCTRPPLALLIFWNCEHRKERMDGKIKNSYDHCNNSMVRFYRALLWWAPSFHSHHTIGLCTVNLKGLVEFSQCCRTQLHEHIITEREASHIGNCISLCLWWPCMACQYLWFFK